MVFVGPVFSQKITALTAYDDFTFVATENIIHFVERNVVLSTIELKQETVGSLAVFGDMLVASGRSSIYFFDLKHKSIIIAKIGLVFDKFF